MRPRLGIACFRETVMKAMKNLLAKLVRDEQGGEVLEYALIAGLIVVAAIAVIGSVGPKGLARWNSLNSGLLGIRPRMPCERRCLGVRKADTFAARKTLGELRLIGAGSARVEPANLGARSRWRATFTSRRPARARTVLLGRLEVEPGAGRARLSGSLE